LAGVTVWALAAPALAQPQPRDHRKADRPSERVPAVAGDKPMARPQPPAASVADFTPKAGGPGTVVTISGRRIGRATAVVFGGREVKLDKVAPRMAVFTVPRVRRNGPTEVVLRHPEGDLAVGSFDLQRGAGPAAGETEPPVEPPPVEPGAAPPVDPGAVAEPPPGGPPGIRPREPGGPGSPPRGPGWHLRGPVVSGFSPLYGTPGTEVTIRGRNFGPNMKVRYEGEEVPAKVAADAIVFVVPKGKENGRGLIVIEGGRRRLVVGQFDATRKWDAKERKRIAAEMRQRAEAAWKQRQAALAKDREARRAALEARERELAQTRAERRRERVEALRGKWEERFLAAEDAQVEIALHAERMARLDRMRRLAEADDRGNLVIRIDVAIERENQRHDLRMEAIKASFQGE
jgi:hypothetical protein